MAARWKSDLAALVLRLALATTFVIHGYYKLWIMEGDKWAPDLNPVLPSLVAWTELVGGLALAVGLLTRLAALGIGVVQVGAILLVTGQREFVHDLIPPGSHTGFVFTSIGFEYNFALLAMCV